MHVSMGYAVPAIALDAATGNVRVPESIFGSRGAHVFDAGAGEQLTEVPLPTDGRPTDLLNGGDRGNNSRAPQCTGGHEH